MIVLVATLRLFFCLYLSNTFFSTWFISPSRKSVISSRVNDVFSGINMPGMVGFIISSLLLSIAVSNLLGSVPGMFNSNIYYFFRAGLSISLWLAVVILVLKTQFSSFVAHLLPYGTPAGLALFLPIIEIFSFLIRPFTLMVRLSTNLSSGHIMLFIFSYFAVAGKSIPSLSGMVGFLIFLLYSLEVFVCLLQAYIFASLLTLYYKETI
jgi:ATP synthase subunit 6